MAVAQLDVTHCPKGHWLGGENLVPSRLRTGARSCLVCNRARTIVANLEVRGHVFEDREAAVDHYLDVELSRTDKGRDRVAADAMRDGGGPA